MKTITWLMPLFSALALSAAVLDERSAESLSTQAADTIIPGANNDDLDFSPAPQSSLQQASAAASCPPGYPKYCPSGAYCCQAKYDKCCPRARLCYKSTTARCCGTAVCGIRQRCCGNRCCPYINGQCCAGNTSCCRPGTYCCLVNGVQRCCYSKTSSATYNGEKAIQEAAAVFDLVS